ncbi:MAG: thiamine pyrophosphate-binding protein [Desulfocucumaceae bacterium]
MTGSYNGGSMIAEVFKKEGIKYIFGLAGGHIYPMMEACEEKGIRYIGVRNEMNAAFMAEGWALTTGTAGVCTGTAGPGFTNLITGLANSDRGGIPVFCLAGKARVTENDRNELQDFNQMDMVKNMTKHARSVAEPHRIPEYVGRALAHCTAGAPGPVYLEIPRDLMDQVVDGAGVEFQETYRVKGLPQGDQADIEAAVKMLSEAKKPLIIAGGGVWWSHACAELTGFAEKTGIPVFTRNAARGAISDSHELCLGIGASRNPVLRLALTEADVVVVIGTRPGYTLTRDVFPPSLKIIRIDIDSAEITNQLDISIGIVGDARSILRQLTDAVGSTNYTEWVNYLAGMKNNLMAMVMPLTISDQTPIHPMRLVAEIRQRIDKDTIIVIDGGDTASWGNLILPAMGPGSSPGIISTSFGPLGVGIPYAIAAKLAHPDKKVILLTGDGAFGYGVMEYDTARRYGVSFTTIILNDACWGMIKRSEAKKALPGKDFIGVDLTEVRYDSIVQLLGGHGEFVTAPEEIGPAIDRAMASGKPACVNVMTDPSIGPML